ncbi:MAG: hypothetical protein NVSMB42_10700 [Herpetosiphon sp.]
MGKACSNAVIKLTECRQEPALNTEHRCYVLGRLGSTYEVAAE